MAQYEHLPIYRSAMQLAVHLEYVVRGFACYNKYTLRSEMRGGALQIVTLLQVGCRYETTAGTRIGKGVMKHYVRTMLATGRSMVLVREAGQRLEKIQERLPFIKLTPRIDNSRKEKLPC